MIIICLGTRPEYLKIKPLLIEFDKNDIKYKKIFTGQHEDLLKDIHFDYSMKIENTNNRLNSIFISVMKQSEEVFDLFKPDYILVQGDTTSVSAFALSAYHHKIKIIHLEAGLRTYDRSNPFPEEVNRRIASNITDIHLCPTIYNKENLINEKAEGEFFIVGNTVLDNLVDIKTTKEKIIMVTLHRRENHDKISEWFTELENLANTYSDYKFIIPLHPNPNVQKYKHILKTVEVINPLGHNEMLELIAKSSLIITDSGGIQEEASFLKKRTIICRHTTERPESIGQSGVLCGEPNLLYETFNKNIDVEVIGECPYGNGYSSKEIVKILKLKL